MHTNEPTCDFYEQLSELCYGDGYHAMLRGYFDESGIHGGSPVCVVAGFVLDNERGSKLAARWQTSVLQKHSVSYFHAKDFAQRSGPFTGWDNARVKGFYEDALEAISEFLYGAGNEVVIAAAVATADFLALTKDERRWLTGGSFVHRHNSTERKWKRQGAPSKPYFLLFQQVILDAVKFGQGLTSSGINRTPPGKKVNFVFDRQDEYAHTARSLLNAINAMPLSIQGNIGSVIFDSKLGQVPLQIADFLAYESFQYLGRRLAGDDSLHGSARRLLGGGRRWSTRFVYFDKDVLAKLLLHSPLTPNSLYQPPDPTY